MKDLELIAVIKEAAFEVRTNLYSGYLESVYQNALVHDLEPRGLFVQSDYGEKYAFRVKDRVYNPKK